MYNETLPIVEYIFIKFQKLSIIKTTVTLHILTEVVDYLVLEHLRFRDNVMFFRI